MLECSGLSAVRGRQRVYGLWVFVRLSKITFGNMVWFSFKWLFAATYVWIWNLSSVFRWETFFWQCSICMTLFMGLMQ
jgi:hypothetical protein